MDKNLILQIACSSIYIVIAIWQFNLIKTLKSKLEILEKFQKIFDVKSLEDYHVMIEKKHQMDIEVIKTERTTNIMNFIAENAVKNLSEVVLNEYRELVLLVAYNLSKQSPQVIDGILSSLPLSEDILRQVLLELNKQKS